MSLMGCWEADRNKGAIQQRIKKGYDSCRLGRFRFWWRTFRGTVSGRLSLVSNGEKFKLPR